MSMHVMIMLHGILMIVIHPMLISLIDEFAPEITIVSDNLPHPFHLQPTHGTLSLTPSLLFIRPRTNQCPWPRPKAQYIILGPYPYTFI